MKAISVIQPWASLIMLGAKRFETRSWQTTHRGPLLIHASKKLPPAAFELCHKEPFKTALAPLLLPYERPSDQRAFQECPWDLPLGFLLGIVEILDCRKAEDVVADITVPEQERAFGDYRPGRWAWELNVLEKFETPIPLPGHLGLWDVPPDLLPPFGPATRARIVSRWGIHHATERTH